MYVFLIYKCSNESVVVMVVSEDVVSATVVCSKVNEIAVILGVVVFSEDRKLKTLSLERCRGKIVKKYINNF